MPPKIESVHKVNRSDMLWIHPDDLHFSSFTGRVDQEADIGWLIDSIEKHGQRQPVTFRKNHEGKAVIITGHSRKRAIAAINAKYPDRPPMLVKALLVPCNDKEAAEQTVIENEHRRSTTPMDTAHNIRFLMENFGHTNSSVAKLYGHNLEWVSQHLALLSLPDPVQQELHAKTLTRTAAMPLTKVDPEVAKEIVKETSDNGKKIPASKVAEQVRQRTNVALPRTRNNLMKFINNHLDDPQLGKFLAKLHSFMEGHEDEKSFLTYMRRRL